VFVLQVLNGVGDFIDLRHGLRPDLRPVFRQMSLEQLKNYLTVNGHCSALVKVLYRITRLCVSIVVVVV